MDGDAIFSKDLGGGHLQPNLGVRTLFSLFQWYCARVQFHPHLVQGKEQLTRGLAPRDLMEVVDENEED